VVAWGKRQFSSDRSKERVAAFRERKRSDDVRSDDSEPLRNGDVTLQKRYRNAPETETETETELEKEREKKDTSLRSVERADKPAPKPRKPSSDEKVFDILTNALSDANARAIIEHRRAKGAKLTERAAELLVKEFFKVHSPDDAAETMIAQGWQGFNVEWYRRARPTGKVIEAGIN
jgi:hypothetical protein